jgi:hypothetical protein
MPCVNGCGGPPQAQVTGVACETVAYRAVSGFTTA